jgi:NitT/TauT family transport system substrate-binding protein
MGRLLEDGVRTPQPRGVKRAMNRRAFLGGSFGFALAGGGAIVRLSRDRGPVLRVGVMANLTHAPLLAGLGSGRIAAAIAPTRLETMAFRAGPRVAEALVGRAIDVGMAGPAPIVVHHARHVASGDGFQVLTGCASGGASFVVRSGSAITSASDLRGKRVAVTQIGTTQDVALRTWLARAGLHATTSGGDVSVLALANATILDEMRRGQLDGAWLAEPWATRLVRELGAHRLIDERSLWDGGRFATALLFTKTSRARDPVIAEVAVALEREVARAVRDPATARDEAFAELKRHVGNPGKRAVFDEAWRYIDFTSDPIRSSVERFADDATSLGLSPSGGATGLFASEIPAR